MLLTGATLDNLKQCKHCKIFLNTKKFNKRKQSKDGLQHVCKICLKSYKNKWLSSIKEEARISQNNITLRFAKAKIALYKTRSKSKNYKFDLTADYLIELWQKQQGKCFYTQKDLVITDKFDFWTATLDRLNPSEGYTQGNVAWTIHGVNCFKQELTLEQFLTFINSVEWAK
jgi:hypothetical protein